MSYEIQIINLLGQELKTIPILNQKEITINRDNLADGMYFYKIIDQNKETVAVGKMVIQ
jgi:type IX secretion system substrate protein